MTSIPVKVTNVSVYAYINPIEPLSVLILKGASGTYSVGTLTTNVFYNLDLDNEGTRVNPLNVHGKYFAIGETEDGTRFTTPWMYCLNNSSQPKFGRTINMLADDNNPLDKGVALAKPSDLIILGELTNITVSRLLPPPMIGQVLLIQNGKGNIVATRTGTPHLMGVQVDSGDRIGHLVEGMENIIVTGTTSDGHHYSQVRDVVVSAGEPAIFLQKFF